MGDIIVEKSNQNDYPTQYGLNIFLNGLTVLKRLIHKMINHFR